MADEKEPELIVLRGTTDLFDKNETIKRQIAALETLSLRSIREFILGGTFPISTQAQYKLQDIDAEIAGLRANLEK